MHLSYDLKKKKKHSSISIDTNIFSTSFFLFVFPCGLNRELMRAAPRSCKSRPLQADWLWYLTIFYFIFFYDVSSTTSLSVELTPRLTLAPV